MFKDVQSAELVDIRDVSVDKSKSEIERLVEYVQQIGDPYHFMCGPFKITAIYPDDAPSIDDCLRGVVR